MKGVGIDMTDIARFVALTEPSQRHALERLFFSAEIAYCESFADAATHFAGTFAAKEAASKALGVRAFPFAELEIRRAADGAPKVWHKNERVPVHISITHTETTAAAVAIA